MTMALINYPAYDHLDEKTRQMLDRTRNEQGRIASFTHMMSKNPAVLEAALGQFSEVMYGGRLGPDLKQLAFVVVSQENGCAYCAASHGRQLVNVLGLPETHLTAIIEGTYGEFTDRQKAVAEFARQAAADPKRVSAAHLEALRDVDFDDADIIELAAVVAQAAFANTFVDVLGILPGDESADVERFYAEKMSA